MTIKCVPCDKTMVQMPIENKGIQFWCSICGYVVTLVQEEK